MSAALIYIHGFNSSPASFKARVLKNALALRAPAVAFMAPALPHAPHAAAALLDALVAAHPGAVLVGSSLGGYYATWLAERHALRAVLVNPAVRPYELLAGHIGRQKICIPARNTISRPRMSPNCAHLNARQLRRNIIC